MSNELAKRVDGITRIVEMDEIIRFAEIMTAGGDRAEATAKIVYGNSLGINPVVAVQKLYLVNNKFAFEADLLASLVKDHPRYDYRATADDKSATVTIYEKIEGEWQEIGSASFGVEDARLAGLLSKETYKKYPSDMFFNRAMSRAVRRHCPNVTGGSSAYVQGEIPESDGESVFTNDFSLYSVEEVAAYMDEQGYGQRPKLLVINQARKFFSGIDEDLLEEAYASLEQPEISEGDYEEIEEE